MARMARAPQQLVAPTSGTIEQQLSEIVGMINSLAINVEAPTYQYVSLIDELGQTWRLYMQSNGQVRTERVTRT